MILLLKVNFKNGNNGAGCDKLKKRDVDLVLLSVDFMQCLNSGSYMEGRS
jgi:hypothetical protein